MKILFVFEFGIMHYRVPLINAIAGFSTTEQVKVVHTEAYTARGYSFTEEKIEVSRLGRISFHHGLQRLMEENDVIIVSFNLWRPSWIPFLFQEKFRKKIILWGQGFGRERHSPLVNYFRILLARRAAALILYTRGGVERFVQEGLPVKKVFLGQNTLEISNASKCEKGTKDQFLFVGRIQKRKGLEELIKAFSIFHFRQKSGKKVKLKIIGEGNKSMLETLAGKLSVKDFIVFEEACFDKDYLKVQFQKSFAYISPNHVGLGVAHSFAYGVPVVTKNKMKHAPEAEYCNDSNSMLYSGNETELAEIMEKLISKENTQYDLGLNAYNYYQQNLKFESMVKGFADAIDFVNKNNETNSSGS